MTRPLVLVEAAAERSIMNSRLIPARSEALYNLVKVGGDMGVTGRLSVRCRTQKQPIEQSSSLYEYKIIITHVTQIL